ncbi:MAG: trypsin-like peptidase domain-containing protein [Proteobacteria bacterium]|nr:trypsin-like peptidase domain-containing protein [Pseudomonadota bacterium]
MKLLISTLFTLLLIGFAGGSYGQDIRTITYSSGNVYVGEFKDDLFSGQGTFIYASGEVENGIWLKNAFIVANNIPPVTDTAPVARATPTLPDSSELFQAASGSAFSVSFDGYLITNNHVIEGCDNVRVHSEGRVIDAAVISRDPGNDLAVIKANFRPAAVFALRESNPQLMQDIYVAGYPFGENLSSSIKVTKGIVSSLTGLGNNFSNIQIDAAIQPGNSGGPIFDDNGNVLGVAVSSLDIMFALENFDAIPQNTNFGIKANIVSNLLSSNGIEVAQPNTSTISTTQLGALATAATFYLSCWMTTAQIQEMSSTKVLFNELRN